MSLKIKNNKIVNINQLLNFALQKHLISIMHHLHIYILLSYLWRVTFLVIFVYVNMVHTDVPNPATLIHVRLCLLLQYLLALYQYLLL